MNKEVSITGKYSENTFTFNKVIKSTSNIKAQAQKALEENIESAKKDGLYLQQGYIVTQVKDLTGTILYSSEK